MDLIAYIKNSDERNPFKIIGYTDAVPKITRKMLGYRGFYIGDYVFKDVMTGYVYTEHSRSMINPKYFILE